MEHVQSTREMFLIEHLGILLEVQKTGVGVELEIRGTVRELHGNLFKSEEPTDDVQPAQPILSASELVDMLLQCEGVHQYTRALLD